MPLKDNVRLESLSLTNRWNCKGFRDQGRHTVRYGAFLCCLVPHFAQPCYTGTSQTLLQAYMHQRLNKIRNHVKTLRSAAIILVLRWQNNLMYWLQNVLFIADIISNMWLWRI